MSLVFARLLNIPANESITLQLKNTTITTNWVWCLDGTGFAGAHDDSVNGFILDNIAVTLTFVNPQPSDTRNGQTLYIVEGQDCNKPDLALETVVISGANNGSCSEQWLINIVKGKVTKYYKI